MTAALLAYEEHGSGTPVVLLHGLTFDRTTWRPIVERLGDGMRSIAIDLPAHGESGGDPCGLDAAAARIHDLLAALEVERPIVVGHSLSGALAFVYASMYPTDGIVTVDQGVDVSVFSRTVKQLEPALRSDRFGEAFAPFQQSMGFDRLAEPLRSLVQRAQRVDQNVVLGYWDEIIRSSPEELQARIDAMLATIDTPSLSIFARPLDEGDSKRLGRLTRARVEVWPGEGHFVHLVDPDRFAETLRLFVASLTADAVAAR